MKKKNGFIAISIIYSFFLCFTMLMAGLLANYASAKILLNKANEPLTYEVKGEEPEPEPEPDEEPGGYTCEIKARKLREAICEDNNNCNNLGKAEDDQGESYYFSGNVKNNYVYFAGNTWRIVRINGDGSVRLVMNGYLRNVYSEKIMELEKKGYCKMVDVDPSISMSDYYTCLGSIKFTENEKSCTKNNQCRVQYDSKYKFKNSENIKSDSVIKTVLEEWYSNSISSDNNKDIVYGNFCSDTSYTKFSQHNTTDAYKYGAYKRFEEKKPSLKCPDTSLKYGGNYKLKIGLLTLDEMVIAGIKNEGFYDVDCNNPNSYLYLVAYDSHYAYKKCVNANAKTWSMSPAESGVNKIVEWNNVDAKNLSELSSMYMGNINQLTFTGTLGAIRPVINVDGDLMVSGNGIEYGSCNTGPYKKSS